MCGIIGYIDANAVINSTDFELMRDTMHHRGPDGFGAEYFKNKQVALGHRRLSIIDLSEHSAQPMSNTEKTIWISFNGEIYNFIELREELSNKYTFTSSGDTEVLVYGYQEWGIDKLVKKLNGMFAFSIWDSVKNKLWIVRDRIGIKPLYYYKKDTTLIFASELKAITSYPSFQKKISNEGLSSYFLYRYVIAPFTIYEDCYKLEPGHYASYDLNTASFQKTQYWKLTDNIKEDNSSEQDKIKVIKELLNDAVKKRALAADVPVQTFLSGGIDSSFITALLNKHIKDLQAFSIEVVDDYKNEIKDAELVADKLQVPLKKEQLNSKKFDSMHDKVIAAYDEPLGDTSNIPTYFLCQLTAKDAKVAMSGDGGDELFYGYNWYLKFNDCVEDKDLLNEYIKTCLNTFDKSQIKSLFKNNDKIEAVQQCFQNKIGDKINKSTVHMLDFHTFMVDDILTKVDTASMCHSLEVRVPFLDHRMVEMAYSINYKEHFKNNELKYLLKKAAEEYLPNDTIYKQKKGFSVPSIRWITADFEHNIINGYASKDNVWEKNELKIKFKGKLHEEQKWLLYNFERWYAFNFHNNAPILKKSLFQKISSRLKLN
tara:strand:- start:90 stop:1886 length:1797 start_codon:yes stop_codon:yes gene_type:complete